MKVSGQQMRPAPHASLAVVVPPKQLGLLMLKAMALAQASGMAKSARMSRARVAWSALHAAAKVAAAAGLARWPRRRRTATTSAPEMGPAGAGAAQVLGRMRS